MGGRFPHVIRTAAAAAALLTATAPGLVAQTVTPVFDWGPGRATTSVRSVTVIDGNMPLPSMGDSIRSAFSGDVVVSPHPDGWRVATRIDEVDGPGMPFGMFGGEEMAGVFGLDSLAEMGQMLEASGPDQIVSRDGVFLRIENTERLDSLTRAMNQRMAEYLRNAGAPVPDALAEGPVADSARFAQWLDTSRLGWNESVAAWIGRSWTAGVPHTALEEWRLPTMTGADPMEMEVTRSFEGRVPCAPGGPSECLLFVTDVTAPESMLDDLMEQIFDQMGEQGARVLDTMRPEIEEFTMHFRTELVVEEATMRPWSSTSRISQRQVMSILGTRMDNSVSMHMDSSWDWSGSR